MTTPDYNWDVPETTIQDGYTWYKYIGMAAGSYPPFTAFEKRGFVVKRIGDYWWYGRKN